MLFAIFLKRLDFSLHLLNYKRNGPVLLFKTACVLELILFPVDGLQRLKTDWNLGQQQDTGHIQ